MRLGQKPNGPRFEVENNRYVYRTTTYTLRLETQDNIRIEICIFLLK